MRSVGNFMLRLLCIASTVALYVAYRFPYSLPTSHYSSGSVTILRSKMPKFSAEEEEELRRILSREDFQIDFSENVNPKKRTSIIAEGGGASGSNVTVTSRGISSTGGVKEPQSSNVVRGGNSQPVKLTEGTSNALGPYGKIPAPIKAAPPQPLLPNSNWRTAASALQVSAPSTSTRRSASQTSGDNVFSFLELDYSDFEQAMREEDNGGMNPMGGGSKHSFIPTEHKGLSSGARINPDVWSKLLDHEGKQCSYSDIHKDVNDVILFYADPRRMTDEFKLVLSQFDRIPNRSQLRAATVLINCDDVNDHRKFKKKNSTGGQSSLLLSDPQRAVMDAMRCKADKRLLSCMGMLDVSRGSLLKVWYEGDWDPVTTRDLLVEEISSYRANPSQFVQSQIGLR